MIPTSPVSSFRCKRYPGLLLAGLFCLLAAGPGQADAADQVVIEFETQEATWLAVDVAPDGQHLALELLGDLYLLPRQGGEAGLLLGGSDFASQPRFSPDGNWLAFISDRSGEDNIWLMRSDGSEPQQLSHEVSAEMISPRWAADGQSVLVSRISPRRGLGAAAELWRYPLDGEPERIPVPVAQQASLLVSSVPTGPLGAAVSADGNRVFFTLAEPRQHQSRLGPSAQIHSLDLLNGTLRQETFQREGAFKPELSTDGRWLAFGAREGGSTGLVVRDLSSGAERWILRGMDGDSLEARATRDILPNFAFTPTGDALIVNHQGGLLEIPLVGEGSRELPFSANIRLSVRPRLHHAEAILEGPVRARVLQGASWDPKGEWAAFSAFGELYLADAATGSVKRIGGDAGARGFHPAWSPDGRSLAFVSWSGTEGGGLWRLDLDQPDQPRLLAPQRDYFRDPVWTPDGSGVVVIAAPAQVRRINDRAQLMAAERILQVDAQQGTVTDLAAAQGAVRPHFADDPNLLWWYSPAAGLVSLDRNSGQVTPRLRVVGANAFVSGVPADDVILAPQGGYAATSVANQLYVFELPPVTSQPAMLNAYDPAGGLIQVTEGGVDGFEWTADGRDIGWSAGARLSRLPRPEAQPAADGGVPGTFEPVISRERYQAKGAVLFRGGRVITMRGDEVLPKADVLVVDGRIAEIGKRLRSALPADTEIIDVRGKTLMPGLVDVHAHWDTKRGVLDRVDYSALANLSFGVTTIRDPQSFDADIFVYSDLVATGEMLGPRIFSTGQGVFLFNRFPDGNSLKPWLERYRQRYQTHLLKSYLVGNRQVRQWLVAAADEWGLMPTTEGGADLKLDLTHAMDGFSGNEHNLPVTPLYRDVTELYARTGISYTPTLLVSFGAQFARNRFAPELTAGQRERLLRFMPETLLRRQAEEGIFWLSQHDRQYQSMAADAARILRAGGNVALGGHGELQGLQAHWEMWALAEGGMTPHEVLRVATRESARAIGLENEIGSLEPGKQADLLVLEANPLEDLKHTAGVELVVVGGRVLRAATLEQVWPGNEAAPRTWWTQGGDQP